MRFFIVGFFLVALDCFAQLKRIPSKGAAVTQSGREIAFDEVLDTFTRSGEICLTNSEAAISYQHAPEVAIRIVDIENIMFGKQKALTKRWKYRDSGDQPVECRWIEVKVKTWRGKHPVDLLWLINGSFSCGRPEKLTVYHEGVKEELGIAGLSKVTFSRQIR